VSKDAGDIDIIDSYVSASPPVTSTSQWLESGEGRVTPEYILIRLTKKKTWAIPYPLNYKKKQVCKLTWGREIFLKLKCCGLFKRVQVAPTLDGSFLCIGLLHLQQGASTSDERRARIPPEQKKASRPSLAYCDDALIPNKFPKTSWSGACAGEQNLGQYELYDMVVGPVATETRIDRRYKNLAKPRNC